MKDERREGHSALQMNNGKIEKFDPHPSAAAGSGREAFGRIWEALELVKQAHAYLNAKTPEPDQAKHLLKAARKQLEAAKEAARAAAPPAPGRDVSFFCTHCGHTLTVKDNFMEDMYKCQNCGWVMKSAVLGVTVADSGASARGLCSIPHHLGEPTADSKALKQKPHLEVKGICIDWKRADRTEGE